MVSCLLAQTAAIAALAIDQALQWKLAKVMDNSSKTIPSLSSFLWFPTGQVLPTTSTIYKYCIVQYPFLCATQIFLPPILKGGGHSWYLRWFSSPNRSLPDSAAFLLSLLHYPPFQQCLLCYSVSAIQSNISVQINAKIGKQRRLQEHWDTNWWLRLMMKAKKDIHVSWRGVAEVAAIKEEIQARIIIIIPTLRYRRPLMIKILFFMELGRQFEIESRFNKKLLKCWYEKITMQTSYFLWWACFRQVLCKVNCLLKCWKRRGTHCFLGLRKYKELFW